MPGHKHAFYLFGIIAGLAIREGLVTVVPRIHTPPAGVPSWQTQLEQFRLIVGMLVVVRFYIGAGVYFDKVHDPESAGYPHRNYYLDFLSGLLHFSIVFAWMTTIGKHHGMPWQHASVFMKLTFLVLVYDVFWLLASWRQSSFFEIKKWAVINALNAVVALLLFLVAKEFLGLTDWVKLEIIVLTTVAIVSLADLWELATERDVFQSRLSRLISLQGR